MAPLLVLQLVLEVVGVENNRRSKQIGQVGQLGMLGVRLEVFIEECLIFLELESDERASRSDEAANLLIELLSVGIVVDVVVNDAGHTAAELTLSHVKNVVVHEDDFFDLFRLVLSDQFVDEVEVIHVNLVVIHVLHDFEVDFEVSLVAVDHRHEDLLEVTLNGVVEPESKCADA